MAISLKHAFNSPKADGVDSTLIQPSNWNAEHVIVLDSGTLIGRSTAGTGQAEEITVGGNLSLTGGSLTLASSVSITALTASGAVTAGSLTLGGVAVTATGAELNFVDGVTSNIQAQLNSKAEATRSVAAGAGLTGGGDLTADRTISHADTSTQASVNNSGNTFIQDITLDTYGHVTSIGSATFDAGAATAALSGDDIGSYVLAKPASGTAVARSFNQTNAGADLRPAGTNNTVIGTGGTALSGTWRCMGRCFDETHLTLWLRIA